MADTFSHDEDATSRWGLIFHGSGLYRPGHHTRQEWACIADAIATADLRLAWKPADVAGPTPTRGDPPWCRVAVDTYDMLSAAGAYWHLRPGDKAECAADEHIIRGWLDAPWVPPYHEPMTMLEANGLDVSFEPDRAPDPASVVILVDHAQQVGVFGAPGHRVGLWRWTERGEFRDGYLVTIRRHGEPGWASHRVDPDELYRVGAAPADTVVGVLSEVARIANTLLDNHVDTVAADRPTTASPATGSRGQPFAAPNPATTVTPAPAPPPPTPPAAPRPRHR